MSEIGTGEVRGEAGVYTMFLRKCEELGAGASRLNEAI